MNVADMRRQILQNIADGRDPYAGFTLLQVGPAIRSVQTWEEGWWRLITYADGRLQLTPSGERELRGE